MATPKKPTSKSAPKKSTKAEAATTESASAKPAVVVHEDHAKHVAASLIARAKAAPAIAPTHESAEFKKLKDSLGKPQHSITSPLSGGNKVGGISQSSAFSRQTAHNQNASANFNKTGVPRRTSGG